MIVTKRSLPIIHESLPYRLTSTKTESLTSSSPCFLLTVMLDVTRLERP